MHDESHELAGRRAKVELKQPVVMGVDKGRDEFEVYVEDWWDKLTGKSWGVSDGNPAAIAYAFRTAGRSIPLDDEVLYVKALDSNMGHLVHASELVPA